jgi:hypothetical protein
MTFTIPAKGAIAFMRWANESQKAYYLLPPKRMA